MSFLLFILFLSILSCSFSSIPFDLGNDIFYIGFNDYRAPYLEDGNYLVNGLSFNSFLIKDKKSIIIESMYYFHKEEWLELIEKNFPQNTGPDYFLIQHFEPDNIGSIVELSKKYPQMQILGTKKCFILMEKYIPTNLHMQILNIKVTIKDGDKLNLGKHTLTFLETPLYHWPEIILAFDDISKGLFSNKVFSKFGSNAVYETWDNEPRRFYYSILSESSKQIQILMERAKALKIEQIYPVHGTLLRENMPHPYYLYGLWTKYKPEEGGVVIAYNAIYNNTKTVVLHLAEKLRYFGEKVILHDLSKIHWNFPLSDAFKYSKLILATITYGDSIMGDMKEFIEHLVEKKFQRRVVGFIENGSWNPLANKIMKQMMDKCEKITYLKNSITIRGKMKDLDWFQIDKMAKEIKETEPK